MPTDTTTRNGHLPARFSERSMHAATLRPTGKHSATPGLQRGAIAPTDTARGRQPSGGWEAYVKRWATTPAATPDAGPPPPESKGWSPWRQVVRARATGLEGRLNRVELAELSPTQIRRFNEARGRVAKAREHAATSDRGWGRGWLSGKYVEMAWGELREVEHILVDLAPVDELETAAADAVAHAMNYLAASDEHLVHLADVRQRYGATQAADAGRPTAAALRAATRSALVASHQQADAVNLSVRHWRNLLLTGTSFLVLGIAAVVVVGWRVPWFRFIDAPAGWGDKPFWLLLLTVTAFSMLGAMMSAVPAMTRTPANRGPYNLPLQQALFKLAFGPVSAFTGLALVSGTVMSTATPAPSMFALAVAFGAAQQAVTGAVDDRAEQAIAAASPTAPKAA